MSNTNNKKTCMVITNSKHGLWIEVIAKSEELSDRLGEEKAP